MTLSLLSLASRLDEKRSFFSFKSVDALHLLMLDGIKIPTPRETWVWTRGILLVAPQYFRLRLRASNGTSDFFALNVAIAHRVAVSRALSQKQEDGLNNMFMAEISPVTNPACGNLD